MYLDSIFFSKCYLLSDLFDALLEHSDLHPELLVVEPADYVKVFETLLARNIIFKTMHSMRIFIKGPSLPC